MKYNTAVKDVDATEIKLAGIDYGNKLAGTTVICYPVKQKVHFLCSLKKQDADQMILEFCRKFRPSQLFIDAPLSLPAAFTNANHPDPDFFYRACDREVKAMSPMFLGGLTARAIKLKYLLQQEYPVSFFESYPGGLAKKLGLDLKNISPTISILQQSYQVDVKREAILNQHHFDALLALLIGFRVNAGLAETIGDPEEGLIYI